MAGRGPAPKDPTKRRRRNTTPPTNKVSADGRTRGPQLPKDVLPEGETWHSRTKAWWLTWRTSPQAKTFTGTDWEFLIDTALMHHQMWEKGRWDFAAELRLRVAKFGATVEDRMRLKMEVEPPPTKTVGQPGTTEGNVTDISSRRKRLAG